jgi:hypothetical protein
MWGIIQTMSMNLAGNTYGRLTVISETSSGVKGQRYWDCLCSCGRAHRVRGDSLKAGLVLSCGCLRIERVVAATATHRMSRTAEYGIWKGMRRRCDNVNDPRYSNYGGRGIVVADQWRTDFSKFFSDMGPRPSKRHSIERRDNNGNYGPDNCYWAEPHTQHRNHRGNVQLTYDGRTQTRTDWADEYGIGRLTLRSRLRYGWTLHDALTKPIRRWGR